AQTGSGAVHGLSFAWHHPSGHAPCRRCRRSFAGVPCSRDVLVWLDCHGCTRSAHVRPYCYVVARTMDTKILAGVVVGGSRARGDRVLLSHNAMVSALAGGPGEDETAKTTMLKLFLENCLIISRSFTVSGLQFSNLPSQGESR